jgi:hypothetical protein
MSSPCSTITSLSLNLPEQVSHTLVVTPDNTGKTELGSISLNIPSIGGHFPDGVSIDWDDYDIKIDYGEVTIFDGLNIDNTFYLNVSPPTFTFNCVAGAVIGATDTIPTAFEALTLTKMESAPITITNSDGTVVLDLTDSIESKIAAVVTATQPTFEKTADGVFYGKLKIGEVTESFSSGKGDFDVTLTFYLKLCLSSTGMGLYLDVGFSIDGYTKSFPFTGLNRYVADINDLIEDFDEAVSDCWICKSDWEIDTLPSDDTVTIPAVGPVNLSGNLNQLLSFTGFPGRKPTIPLDPNAG